MSYHMGEYYERVDDYELEYQSQSEQDVPFWRELVMRYTPQRVLELACGSGRIGLELLHMPGDFQLEGLDIAPEMLAAYRRKLEREPEDVRRRVRLHEADMCDYALEHKGEFDLIDLLELRFRFLIAGIHVRVILASEPAKCLFNFVDAGSARHTQYLIIIFIFHIPALFWPYSCGCDSTLLLLPLLTFTRAGRRVSSPIR